MTGPPFVADFDSASAMLRANARFLRGLDFPHLGIQMPSRHLIPVANLLPAELREQVYTWSGWAEAIPESMLPEIAIDDAERWAADEHPRRRYPAVALGSSNGAAVHLFAALGIPWLPQTWLIPVRRHGIDADDMRGDMEWGRDRGRRLLAANPDLQLHHMHDPNQDWLMVRHMTYFRVKRRSLGVAYRELIEDTLEPGGTLLIVECEQRWPVVQVGERHWFQPGAMGGMRPAEYLAHSGIQPTGEQPEAEWGFEPALLNDINELAASRGYRVRRLRFEHPEELSPFVGDLHRWWYQRLGRGDDRVLADSFILMEPYWALRTGSVPWWALFGTDASADRLETYLRTGDGFEEIYVMLFSHGVKGVGLTGIPRWRHVLSRARRHGAFIGVDESEFPRDFATLARYHDDLRRKIRVRLPLPAPLTLADLDEFVARVPDGKYRVRLEEGGGDDRIRTGE